MKGLIKKQVVPFLMDTGSAHNFISANWVKTLELKSQSIRNFPVMVASDKELFITRSCTQVEWKFNDHIFQADYLVLPSSAFGVILGMQWFKTLGEISWNYGQLTMKLEHDKKRVCLQGPVCYSDLEDEALHKFPHSQQSALTQLLENYQQLFKEPTTLPPKRQYDHQISLVSNKPFCLKPYKYPHAQKEEIERQVKALLTTGFIRKSGSCYASPLVLVKKKGGSRRFCTDFRKLNALKIKQ
uniref:Retrovirus-related Pol polyprotein from transposon 17.6 n=1 Tax=Cajanus cajan TaxID=3821 RepID=A0A151U5Y3_CAJCA|nr:Retrovirus-related Pol polyprotein from transposon 17.6 [Cajanus cajan]